jgi:hypothetical protein
MLVLNTLFIIQIIIFRVSGAIVVELKLVINSGTYYNDNLQRYIIVSLLCISALHPYYNF